MHSFLWFVGDLFDVFGSKGDLSALTHFFEASRKQYYYYLLGLNYIFDEKGFNIFMTVFRFFAMIFYDLLYGCSINGFVEYLSARAKKVKEENKKRKAKKCHFVEEKGDSECRCPLDQPCEC